MGFRRTTANAKVFRIPVEINVTKGETMAMPAFDTHKAVKALSSAGFDNAQAEAVVDQISGAVNENVATKTDVERLATREELRDEVVRLATKADLERFATKEELRQEVAELATKTDLERFATKEELRQNVAELATKTDLERFATKEDLSTTAEKFELRLSAEIEKHASKSLRSIVVVAAAIVGVTKALDLLVG